MIQLLYIIYLCLYFKYDNKVFKSFSIIRNMQMRLSKTSASMQGIYSPRTAYKRIKEQDQKMIADMTLNFDKLTINQLREQFRVRGNTLDLGQFISITKKHLKFWQVELPNRDSRLVRYLSHLFNEIDINGNGDMEWDEFTNYIIEKATVLKNLKSKNDQIKHYIRSQVAPKTRVETLIQKLQYLPDVDRVAYYQQGSNKIQFISAQTGQQAGKCLSITPKQLVVSISSVKKQKTGKVSIRKKDLVLPTSVRVLDMLYLPQKKYRVLLVATSDGYVRGWRCSQNAITLATQPDNQQESFEHHFPTQIYSMAWDNINEVLYCGQKGGGIYMWNLKTDLQKTLAEPSAGQCESGQGQQRVNLMITTMITMPKLQFMASGRMDGKLLLWDTINSVQKTIYGGHSRGILSLAYNENMILLFSAGFDHKICIWNPYIETLIHKIEGHLSPILSLRVIQGTHQLISMDSQGIVKVTDTRRFNIISSFSAETDTNRSNLTSQGLSCFITINKPAQQVLRLVFGGRCMSFYDYDKNYNPTTADENPVMSCRYIKDNLSFYTPAGNKIKVWSALNGDVEKIYMDITAFQISAFDFDYLRKRMVIGDNKGNVALYNTANGAKMKNLSRHSAEITHLIAIQHPESKIDIFVSCGLDNQIRISRQTPESFEVVRTVYLKRDLEVTCMKYCPQNRLLVVGSNTGSLSFFDIETGKNVGNFVQQPPEQISSISLALKQIVIVSTTSGTITLLGVPPFPYRFQKLLSFKHQDCEKKEYGRNQHKNTGISEYKQLNISKKDSINSTNLPQFQKKDSQRKDTTTDKKQLQKKESSFQAKEVNFDKKDSQNKGNISQNKEGLCVQSHRQHKLKQNQCQKNIYGQSRKGSVGSSYSREGSLGVRLTAYNRKKHHLYVVDDKMYLSCYDLSMLMSQLQSLQLGREKIEFQRKNIIRQALNRSKISLVWQNKGHYQSIKVLQFIEEQSILMTAALDRKVKLWNAHTGEYIDSLQQNYNKAAPEPLAYYDNKKGYLYTSDKKKAFDSLPLAPAQLDFNPFLIQQIRQAFNPFPRQQTKESRQDYFPSLQTSNKQWSLSVAFEQVAKKQHQYFEQVQELLARHQSVQQHSLSQGEDMQKKKQELIQKKNKMMKQIRKQAQPEVQAIEQVKDNHNRKYSANYFRRSMVKCIKSFVDKNQTNQLMQSLKRDASKVFGKKIDFDYVPIYKMLSQTVKSQVEVQQHKQYVLDLARRQTENIKNGKNREKVLLSKEETEAANKLYYMLRTTEGRQNTLPIGISRAKQNKNCRENNKSKLRQTSELWRSNKSRFCQSKHEMQEKLPPIE